MRFGRRRNFPWLRCRTVAIREPPAYIGSMNLELTDEETALLERELRQILDNEPIGALSHLARDPEQGMPASAGAVACGGRGV
jgi:hypothetical protein